MAVGARVEGSQCSTEWRRCGSADTVAPWTTRPELTGAPRYMAMVPHFRWFFFLRSCGTLGISPGQSSASGGQQKGLYSGGYVELDFGGGGSWFHRSDGAGNQQNGGGSACRRLSGCWFSMGGSTTAQQRWGVVARVSTPTLQNSSVMRFYV
jgi:hypothetical protein